MMDPSTQLSTVDKQSLSRFSLEDDDTVATPPKGEKSMPCGSTVEEKNAQVPISTTQGQ
jgi:hypothetical protein